MCWCIHWWWMICLVISCVICGVCMICLVILWVWGISWLDGSILLISFSCKVVLVFIGLLR